MRIATRIRQVRLEHKFSLEELARKAQMAPSLLSSFENGQEIPSLEMVDRLAAAMDVPVVGLFYDDLKSALTPWLTPRLTLQQLANEPFRSISAEMASLLKLRKLRAATRELLSFVTIASRRLMGKTPHPPFPSTNSCEQDGADSSMDWKDTNPRS
jgi:transcriptional regulator with XRE-family HTH domain